jgi:formate/nitrite transporter
MTLDKDDFDALMPREMAARAEEIGAAKTRLDGPRLLVLGVLAGAFIGFGAMLATIVTAGGAGAVPYGILRVTAGLVFSLGLILVVVGGAELFTGNTLMVMAWANGKVRGREVMRAWAIVYVGNAIGAVATAFLVFLARNHELGNGAVGIEALTIAEAKAGQSLLPCLVDGVLANTLVCLAVWLTYSARTTTDKVLVIVPPIAAFVAAGFEHSVANMYFLPYGLMLKTWTAVAPGAYGAVVWSNSLINIVVVTVGNMVGGVVLVAGVYWFVYLRRHE